MKRLFAAAVFLVVSATGAIAGFVANYSDWKQKSPFAQSQYAMGLLDGQLIPNGGDNGDIARSQGLDKCAFELGLTGAMIAEAITRFYQDNTDKWGVPPLWAFQVEIVSGACLNHINTERAKYGLEPWKKP